MANLTHPINDYYDRIAAMCEEAVTNSNVVPDFTVASTGGLWWQIKLAPIRRVSGDQRRSRRKFAWDIYFILGAASSDQGKSRQELYTKIWDILDYFDSRNNLTTTTTEMYEEFRVGIEFNLVNEGVYLIGDGSKVRGAQFRLEFNSDTLVTRSL